MDDRQSIIGFTEAELGFFLVLLCVALWVVTIGAKKPVPPARPPIVRADITPDSLAKLKQRVARLQREVDSLRSPIWPSCRSKRIAATPLLTVVAIGGGRFRVDGDTVGIRELAAQTAESRDVAQRNQCRHEVRFGVRRDLTAAESEAARRRIGELLLRILPGPVVDQ